MAQMAEMAAEAFLKMVFKQLFKLLTSPELRKNSVAAKLKMLGEKLEKVRLYQDDAEDKQLFDKDVKKWLDELKHVVFMAQDLVEEINNSQTDQRSKRKAVMRAIKSVYQSLAKTVQGEIDLILTDLDGLLGQALVLELNHVAKTVQGDAQSSRSSRTIIAPSREEHHVYGREAEKEKILEMLFSKEEKIGVLPIVGMGGLGKTTLAKLVYDDKRVEEHGFTLKAQVTVSTQFDFIRIIKELLRQVNPGTSTSNINNPNELQQLMKEAVRGKKFLFVLDDVWDENYDNWDPIMTSFTTGDFRSRIIVTTRSSVVGSNVKTGPMYEPEKVGDDDCWSIFVHHAFSGDTNADPELQAIGRKIVAKCKGLPLAVKSIGGLLRSERDPQKWESIIRRDVGDWSKVMENGVLPSLWLSYRYLPSSLKQCFAYCSLFPQDYEFHKKKLVRLWMAEGFLPSDEKDKSMEEVGEQYLDDLVSRSLFQRSYKKDKEVFVMHDLVHDLAAFVYGQFCFRKGDVTIRTRHFLLSDEEDNDLLTALSKAKHLRTIIRQDRFGRSLSISKEMATKTRCLRVLSGSLRSSVLHHSLGDLKMLRFLDLSWSQIEELPDSICSLFHLQTLILSYSNINRLPTEMGKLVELRFLDLSRSEIEELPDSICSLFHLQTLTLSDCENLTRLPTEMGKLVELRFLDLSRSKIKELPDSICSLFHLQTLILSKCHLTRLPTEMGKLIKLRHLDMCNLKRLEKMPPNMGNLKELRILTDFVSGVSDDNGCSTLKELGELKHLGGKLRISQLENVRNLEDVQNANILRDKAEMKKLILTWNWDGGDKGAAVDVLEALRPHTNLESLQVLGYPGSSFPKWVGETSFSKMVSVNLWGSGNSCGFLPPLGQLPSLWKLDIGLFEGVKKIGNEFLYGNDSSSITPFPSLQKLSFTSMSRWEEWSFVGSESGCFPRLQSLSISSCPKLKSIREEDTQSTKLKHLEIIGCDLLERRYQKYKGDGWPYISHIPNIRISGSTTRELEHETKEDSASEIE